VAFLFDTLFDMLFSKTFPIRDPRKSYNKPWSAYEKQSSLVMGRQYLRKGDIQKPGGDSVEIAQQSGIDNQYLIFINLLITSNFFFYFFVF
jgi:hypothetical protein